MQHCMMCDLLFNMVVRRTYMQSNCFISYLWHNGIFFLTFHFQRKLTFFSSFQKAMQGFLSVCKTVLAPNVCIKD